MHPEDQPLDPCCHLANIVEDNTDKISFAYDIMNRAMSRFAKLLWPLLISRRNCSRPLGTGERYWPGLVVLVLVARWSRSTELLYVGPG